MDRLNSQVIVIFVCCLSYQVCTAVTSHRQNSCPSPCTCNKDYTVIDCQSKRLDDIPMDIPTTARQLNLDKNNLAGIKRSSFHTLANLTLLSLKANRLLCIDEYAFEGLSSLKHLFLTNNYLPGFHKESFYGLTSLSYLYLSQNRLKEVPDIIYTTQLLTLALDNNHIQLTKFPDSYLNFTLLHRLILNVNIGNKNLSRDSFKALKNADLNTLEISRCSIRTVEEGSFSYFPRLKTLKLSYNENISMSSLKLILDDLGSNAANLTTLDISGVIGENIMPDLFSGLNSTSLTKVDMAHSKNTGVLRNGTFDYFGNLVRLDISSSDLAHVEDGVFNMNHLEYLNLMKCSLKAVPKLALPRLLILDMSGNVGLDTLETGAFSGLHDLTTLHLNNGRIRVFRDRAFDGLSNVTFLDLSNNDIAGNSFGRHVLSAMSCLKTLILKHNHLDRIINEKKLFSGLTNLELLDMSDNGCSSLPNDIFRPLTKLTTLVLSNNRLGYHISTHPQVFQGLTSLRALYLGSNHVNNLSPSGLHYLPSLREVYLNNNFISSFNGTYFHTPSISLLNLTNNRVSVVNESSLSGFVENITIDFTLNPFSCSCDLIWFRDWIEHGMENSSITLAGLDRYRCYSPESMVNVLLLDFDPNSIRSRCYPPPWKYIIIAVSCGTVLAVLLLSVTLYRHRWPIRLRWYMLKKQCSKSVPLTKSDYEPIPGDDVGTDDITLLFSIHSGRDEDFVRNHLYPWFTGEMIADKRLLSWHEILPNANEFDAMFDFIYQSRKVICVISRDFVKDVERCFQMEHAIRHVIKLTDINRGIVLVLLDDDVGVRTKLPKSLTPILEEDEALVWSDEDADCQNLFWRRLRSALSSDSRTHSVQT